MAGSRDSNGRDADVLSNPVAKLPVGAQVRKEDRVQTFAVILKQLQLLFGLNLIKIRKMAINRMQ